VQKDNFKYNVLHAIRTLKKRPDMFMRDKRILTSERILHKDYERKGSVSKKNLWS
jgi:hypothetical protein